jgi:Cu/Ag efflux protein CusF
MRIAGLRLALPLIICGLASGDSDEVQETAAEGIFFGRGIVKEVAPKTGWLTLAHGDIKVLHAGDGDDVSR